MNNATPAATKPQFVLRSKVWKLPRLRHWLICPLFTSNKSVSDFFKKSSTYFTKIRPLRADKNEKNKILLLNAPCVGSV